MHALHNDEPDRRERLSERDQLLLEHLPLVHHVAHQVLRQRALDIDLDELVSAGTLGLMEALKDFEPQRGLAISTFVMPRIRGAILDELRRRDHLTRGARRRVREEATARESLSQELGRSATSAEVASRLGISALELSALQRDAQAQNPIPLDLPLTTSSGDRVTPAEVIADERQVPAESALERREQVRILKEEILRLSERHRLVLSLYYFEELKLHQIAGILGVTESRISQIRSKALKELREALYTRLGIPEKKQ
jgi:RNA polymerase sigma factor for flagellar operon FliA